MRVFGLTVGYNETGRYLEKMLDHHHDIFDHHFFFDDWSSDRTLEMAMICGAVAMRRTEGQPSFVNDEGAFREAAWRMFELAVKPQLGDWVLVIDCDEFLTCRQSSDPSAVRLALRVAIEMAEMGGRKPIVLDFSEIFALNPETGQPYARTDRLWGTIHAPRLFPYFPNGHFTQGPLGVPAVPSYVMGMGWGATEDLHMLHYGYARVEDQEAKYRRYSGRTGHSNDHVESIPAEDKVLVPLDWPWVDVRRQKGGA